MPLPPGLRALLPSFSSLPLPPPPPPGLLRRLHPLLKVPVRMMPFPLQRRLLERLLRETFQEHSQQGRMQFLYGRWVRFQVTDLGSGWNFSYGALGPIVADSPLQPDVTIRGDMSAFVSLAQQEEDPDTLFFQRRLVIEGDTELGLQVKNLMFAAELPPLARELARGATAYFRQLEKA
ncbi:MAG: SCP2 sterol-binding domain-containing protein [Moraxellaceae bacterium]|nr:SCP2 sterol-binding domain-containing protein [Moraxellaceae bacterium]MBP8853295.1 SCP2 sterol-binding domain-containing protein [Moraxellaceae bacterium]MBP9046014.1 SCP2 sterol-binding domain-containing protein [Moraxellaceae bacterium]MBP9731435.1 SCP2 sterol-binding domain-containing protein [Moraxellaceae bacterium]